MIILRYSDYEADTLESHIAKLADGPVLWGWWKKQHEAFPHELLERVARRASEHQVRVGLLHRVDEKFAVGICSEIVYRKDGEEFASPNKGRTPMYYQEERCAAWFSFEAIHIVSEETWVDEFGPIPSGDSTIFEARRARPADYPVPVISATSQHGQSGILHISDLHFGSDHGYPLRAGPANPPVPLAEKIVSALPVRPACVVVSGDLTTRGESDGFLSARIFIEKITELLDMQRNAVVLIPGNHDILIDDPTVTRDFRNEQAFRDHLQIFYGAATELERVHDIRDASGRHYLIGALNSSRPRLKENMDYGYVGIDRSAPVFKTVRICADLARSATWTAVALHHHVLPGSHVEEPENKRPVSMTLDAGEIVSLAHAERIDAVLHGHQHLPFIGQVARVAEFTLDGATQNTPITPVTVFGAGSAGVQRPRIPDPVGFNTFSFYRPFDIPKATLVECFGYLEQRNVHRLWCLTV